ncbi:hypothetical protein EJB05_47200, partial [Eragrostis curvula]
MVMASAGVNMSGSDGNPAAAANSAAASPECRFRRRRRLSPPPAAAATAGSSSGGDPDAGAGPSRRDRARRPAVLPPSPPASSSEEGSMYSIYEEDTEEEEEGVLPPMGPVGLALPAGPAQPQAGEAPPPVSPVAFGSVALAGRMREMEDTISMHPGFYTWVDGTAMHFFAVFDGHGGTHVSALCRDQMHVILAEELAAEASTFLQRRRLQQRQEEEEEEASWRSALMRAFARVDSLAALACATNFKAGHAGAVAKIPPNFCGGCGLAVAVAGRRFRGVMEQGAHVSLCARARGGAGVAAGCAGPPATQSPATVAVSLCGGSRRWTRGWWAEAPPASLLLHPGGDRERNGSFIQWLPHCCCSLFFFSLGEDGWSKTGMFLVAGNKRSCLPVVGACANVRAHSWHKPNRPDELARIESVGGQVINLNGPRVRGILAMSRALGDRFLRPEVISEPEITITQRTEADQCLILASDGMWDAISNETACAVARAAAATAAPGGDGQGPEDLCQAIASILARLALGRGSPDNVSVIVVDLQNRAG